MTNDFPDGSRSNVAKDKQDLAMLLSHPHTLWDTAQLEGNEQRDLFLYNQDLNHVYVLNAVCLFMYDVHHFMFHAYHNDRYIASGHSMFPVYIPIDYSRNITMLYGDYVKFELNNYDSSAQWFLYYALVTVYPKPSTFVRRPMAFFSLDDYSVAVGATVTATNNSGYSPESYEWDWGDGSAVETTENSSHHYHAAGVYEVSLTVKKGSLSDTYITRVTVT